MVWVCCFIFKCVTAAILVFFPVTVINTMANSNFHSIVYNPSLREPKQKLKAEP